MYSNEVGALLWGWERSLLTARTFSLNPKHGPRDGRSTRDLKREEVRESCRRVRTMQSALFPKPFHTWCTENTSSDTGKWAKLLRHPQILPHCPRAAGIRISAVPQPSGGLLWPGDIQQKCHASRGLVFVNLQSDWFVWLVSPPPSLPRWQAEEVDLSWPDFSQANMLAGERSKGAHVICSDVINKKDYSYL